MKTLQNFLSQFDKKHLNKNYSDFTQYVKNEYNYYEFLNLAQSYKPELLANEKEGLYIKTFRFKNTLGYKEITVIFQNGIYKSNRHLNSTIVNLFN